MPINRWGIHSAQAIAEEMDVDSTLKKVVYESLMQEQGRHHHPLSDAAKERNRERAKIRSRVEHVFGQMEMRGKLKCWIRLVRVKTWWCLRNLVFHFLRSTQQKYWLGSPW